MSQDSVKVAPKIARVLFENDRIRIVEIKLKKRQKMEMHSHPANAVYAITRSRIKSTSPDGKAKKLKMKKGQVNWSDGGSHAVENLDKKAALSLVIELKK
jgi:quercetin dioxygenase-like cupin family protein